MKNLKPGDVSIYEDGVKQDVKSFRFVGTREVKQEQKATTAATPTATSGVQPLRAVNVICVVFHNLDPVSRRRGIEAVQEFLKTDLPPNTYIGMFTLDDRLNAVYPFTKDRAEAQQALQSVFSGRVLDFGLASEAVLTANPNQYTVTATIDGSGRGATILARLTGGELAKTVVNGAEVSNGTGANVQRGNQVLERRDFSNISGMRATDSIITMIDRLGTLPGRKIVLLATTGLVTTGDPDRFESIVEKANKAGMTIYSLDVTGLDETSSAQASNIALGRVADVSRSQTAVSTDLSAAKEKSRQGDTMMDAVRSSNVQSALRALSEGTGGFLIANTNDFRKPFQKILDDVEWHYEASYKPSSDKYDGRLRNIEVKLDKPDLSVESRTGYFAMPEAKVLKPFEVAALAVLSVNPKPKAFNYETAVYRFRNDGTNSHDALAVEIPGATLAAAPIPARQTHSVHTSLMALVKDSSGQVVDTYSVDAPYEIPDANIKAVLATPQMYTHPLMLPAGRYTVETAVLDREAGRSSTSVTEFVNPESQNKVAISSVLLIQRIESVQTPDPADPLIFQGKRLVPVVGGTLPADAKPYAYFVVYPNHSNTEKPKIQVEFRVDGQLLANQTADLPAPDATGRIPMIIKAATHAGTCELKITAVQGNESATERVTYSIPK